MLSWLVRLIIIVASTVAGWFVAIDSPGFELLEFAIGLLLIAVVLFALAFWPTRWTESLDHKSKR
jgi:hypothetical protein